MADQKQSIVMFPFMAQGHIIPFLALALQIQRKSNNNYTIYFVNTPLNIQKLSSLNSPVHFLQLPFSSSTHGLPPQSENADTLPYHLLIRLLQASSSLKSAFKELILSLTQQHNGNSPLCIISDIFLGWTADVAKEMGVFHAIFSGAGGFGLACYYSLWMNLPHREYINSDENQIPLPDFHEASNLHRTQLPITISEANGEDDWSIFQKENLTSWVNSNFILFNTVEEFDEIGLSYFRRKFQNLEVKSIGPLVLSLQNRDRIVNRSVIKPESCVEWLDSKALNSVLYVSFGSMNTISPSQMMQLGMALEASNQNFIWVVRPPIGFDINSEFKAEQWLPRGFEERNRVSGKGLVLKNWAPQVEILKHKAVCAFLSHCGWNSTLESLSEGVPMIGWPLAGEQFFNVKLLEEKIGVCVEVARGKICEVKYEDIVKKIEMVMSENDEKGKEMRRKACEVREKLKNAWKDEDGFIGSSVKSMDDFLYSAKLFMKKKKQGIISALTM